MTFNIEKKLRLLSEKFENFCHVFAIYDVCQFDVHKVPELLAARGRLEDPDEEDSDSPSELILKKPADSKVPYFHISSARVGGPAKGNAGFAARCLEFAQ